MTKLLRYRYHINLFKAFYSQWQLHLYGIDSQYVLMHIQFSRIFVFFLSFQIGGIAMKTDIRVNKNRTPDLEFRFCFQFDD